jgi:hypothetical protein
MKYVIAFLSPLLVLLIGRLFVVWATARIDVWADDHVIHLSAFQSAVVTTAGWVGRQWAIGAMAWPLASLVMMSVVLAASVIFPRATDTGNGSMDQRLLACWIGMSVFGWLLWMAATRYWVDWTYLALPISGFRPFGWLIAYWMSIVYALRRHRALSARGQSRIGPKMFGALAILAWALWGRFAVVLPAWTLMSSILTTRSARGRSDG